jgi:hypothetical protein
MYSFRLQNVSDVLFGQHRHQGLHHGKGNCIFNEQQPQGKQTCYRPRSLISRIPVVFLIRIHPSNEINEYKKPAFSATEMEFPQCIVTNR